MAAFLYAGGVTYTHSKIAASLAHDGFIPLLCTDIAVSLFQNTGVFMVTPFSSPKFSASRIEAPQKALLASLCERHRPTAPPGNPE